MEKGSWVIIAIAIVSAVFVLLTRVLKDMKVRYYLNHPPNGWDGLTEDDENDDTDSGS